MSGQAPPLGARLTTTWLRAYTRRLPHDVAVARRDEVLADVHDQLSDDGSTSTAQRSRAIAVRMLLGIPADLSWRTEQARTTRSARHQEIAMNDIASTRNRGLAIGLGVLVVAWGATMTIGSVLADVGDAPDDATALWAWFAFAAASAVGVVGLVLLARGRDRGAALLAFAAVGTTLPFFWMPPIPIAGLLLAAFFVGHLWRRPTLA
jgi:hypothetical protein